MKETPVSIVYICSPYFVLGKDFRTNGYFSNGGGQFPSGDKEDGRREPRK